MKSDNVLRRKVNKQFKYTMVFCAIQSVVLILSFYFKIRMNSWWFLIPIVISFSHIMYGLLYIIYHDAINSRFRLDLIKAKQKHYFNLALDALMNKDYDLTLKYYEYINDSSLKNMIAGIYYGSLEENERNLKLEKLKMTI